MRKHWIKVVSCPVATLIIGFLIGFHFGEKMYSWIIKPFHNTDGKFDMLIVWTAFSGLAAFILATVAIWQTHKAHKTSTKILDIESEKMKLATMKMNSDKLIIAEIIEHPKTEIFVQLNECDDCSELYAFYFVIQSKNNMINSIKIKDNDRLIADKAITIMPGESKVLRLYLNDYEEGERLFELYLKGNSNFVTIYSLRLVTDEKSKMLAVIDSSVCDLGAIALKEYRFIAFKEDTKNAD